MSSSSQGRSTKRAHAIDHEDPKRRARQTLAKAMIAIGRSNAPLQTFKAQEASIAQAMKLLGRNYSPEAFLKTCGLADEALGAKPAATAPQNSADRLPQQVQQKLQSLWRDEFGVDGEVKIEQVIGGPVEGFEFEYTVADQTHEGFAIQYDGHWFLAPGPIEAEDIGATALATRKYFDITMAIALHKKGKSDDEIMAIRQGIHPARLLWPHEIVPEVFGEEFPMVFLMQIAPEVTGHRVLCGLEPISGKCKAIALD